MTYRLDLPKEALERRFIALRADVALRKTSLRDTPRAYDAEHPIVRFLWDSLVWLHDYWAMLCGYIQQVAGKRGAEVVSCLESSAQLNHLQTVSQRMLELYDALKASDPATIPDPTLRRLVAIARVQTAAEALREVKP